MENSILIQNYQYASLSTSESLKNVKCTIFYCAVYLNVQSHTFLMLYFSIYLSTQ